MTEIPSFRITRYNHPSQNWTDAVLALRAEFHDSDSPEPFTGFVARRLEDESMLLVLLWDGDRAIGYALAFDVDADPAKPEWTRTGYISQFLITASCRNKGTGDLLMQAVDAWFAERGLDRVLLNVNLDNPGGIRFWEKHGFTSYAYRMKRTV
jgi:GNAT superfamily N-acetyltransferase